MFTSVLTKFYFPVVYIFYSWKRWSFEEAPEIRPLEMKLNNGVSCSCWQKAFGYLQAKTFNVNLIVSFVMKTTGPDF